MDKNFIALLLLLISIAANVRATINCGSDDSYNLGIAITQSDINTTLNALSVANYIGFAAPGPITNYVTVNGFRIKVTSAAIDLSTLDNQNVCNLTMTMDGKADGYWNNTLIGSILGDFKVKSTFSNVKLKVKLDIQKSDDGKGYYLVAIPVGWDAGDLSIVSSTFQTILSIASYIYNGVANPISHMYAGHMLNKPIKLASVSVLYQNLPQWMMEKGAPSLSFANNMVFVGWKASKMSQVPTQLLLN